MKKVIRASVFETNSSSTHSLSIVATEDFNAWENGSMYYYKDTGELVTKDLVMSLINFDRKICSEFDYNNCNRNCDSCYEETIIGYPDADKPLSITEYMKENNCNLDDILHMFGYVSYELFQNKYWFTDEVNYRTKNGDDVTSFMYYEDN